ncbi:MAG: PQQ-binding-like beta-propeller repeat protein [Pirellulales bacterium]
MIHLSCFKRVVKSLRLRGRNLATLLLYLAFSVPACHADEGPAAGRFDWPNWRGPEQNRHSRERNLIDRWDLTRRAGGNLAWKNAKLAGRSTPIVLRGRLYTLVRDQPGTPSEGEKVVCADATTGEILWENRFNVYLSDVPAERVGWSCCVGDRVTGKIYALGVCGFFQCLDGATGKTLWSHSLHEAYGLLSTYGGRTNMPVIHDDLVIISSIVIGWGDSPQWGNYSKPAHRFMAFNKQTGEMVWFKGTRLIPYDTTYSTPTLTSLAGEAAMVFGSGDGAIWALQPRTGNPIWKYQFSRRGISVSPLVVGETVYAGHAEENIHGNRMGGFVAIDATGTGNLTGKERWRLEEVMVGKSSPVWFDGQVVAVDNGAKLLAFDPRSGARQFRKPLGGSMFSTPLVADVKIYLCTENRNWYILRPDKERMQVVHRVRAPRGAASYGSPIVSRGRIYVPTTEAMYCFAKPGSTPTVDPIPSSAAKASVDSDPKPAALQVVPCDVLLRPGEATLLTARLFNARGEFLKAAPARFTLKGPGTISGDGRYQAPADARHTATLVTAETEGVTGTARIRVVPPLPWKFSFDDLDEVPITWIGGRVRYELRDVEGQRILVKRSLIPTRPGHTTKLGTRSRLWMGQPELADYTVQADVLGRVADRKMPDIGLICQRYTFDLQGAGQQVQIRTWGTELRMAKTVPFAWQPETWYTMKVTTRLQGDQAVVQGKVWPREEKEPEAWTVVATDPAPNRNGSPGLYGNAKDAEIYIDNISVVPNTAHRKNDL